MLFFSQVAPCLPSRVLNMSTLNVAPSLLHSLFVMGAIVEARDAYTGGHLWRVGQYSKWLAEQAGLSRHEVFLATAGGFLHDLGKVGIPDAILNKPGRLDDQEYAVIKTHPAIGVELLQQHPLAPLALDAVSYHHERPDGQGYPYRLNGEETPVIARIVAIADAFDAMTSTRPYRRGMPMEQALAILREEQGRQFDEALCGHFLALATANRLEHIIAHSFHDRRLVDCPMCGPAVIAIDAATVDGGLHYCRACRGEFRLHRSGDTFVAEFTGGQADPDQIRPRPDFDPIEDLLADEMRLHSGPVAAAPASPVSPAAPLLTAPSRALILQLDSEQGQAWREALRPRLKTLLFPADSDVEIGLRILAAEAHAPDLAIIDVAYFLTRNANPYAFAAQLARWSSSTRVVLTNSAATRIVESMRSQATRRGAIDLLPALPSDRTQAQAIVSSIFEAAMRPSAPVVDDADGEARESEDQGPLADAAKVVIAMRSPGGVAIQDRSYRFKTYPCCFIGVEAAEWLQRTYSISRQEALAFGSSLVTRRVIHHVANDHDFKDEHLFYRFTIDDVVKGE